MTRYKPPDFFERGAPPLYSRVHDHASLLGRLAVEMFGVGPRIRGGPVDYAIPVIRRRVERIEFQCIRPGVGDVVSRPGGDDDGETRADGGPGAVESRLTGARFHADELIECMNFGPDLLPGLK
jgi:hypothetical protein